MHLFHTTLRLLLAAIPMVGSTSCASVLTTWHDRAYTPVVDANSELVETADETAPLEQVADLASSADELYRQGYVLVGYTKFSHTLAPGFQAMYAKMYGDRIGAARVVQAEPVSDGGVHAYTVTYWARGKRFPFGAYYDDLPRETLLLAPDSLRGALGEGGRPVRVEAVVAGSPADRAGVERGELIVAVDGVPFAGTEGLDALIPDRADEEITLTVWSFDGLREVDCAIEGRLVCADGYGAEGLYVNQPWAAAEYTNFQKYSEAFTNAWNSSIDSYRATQQQAQEDAYHASQYAYFNSQVSRLEGEIDDLERDASRRGESGLIDVERAREQGAKNWKEFSKKISY